MLKVLNKINEPKDLKELTIDELNTLAEEIREGLFNRLTKYSAHAKADEMIEFLNQFKNLKLVLVNHGESWTKNIFAELIVEEVWY